MMEAESRLSSTQADLQTECDVIVSLHQAAIMCPPAQARQNGSHHPLATDLDLDKLKVMPSSFQRMADI